MRKKGIFFCFYYPLFLVSLLSIVTRTHQSESVNLPYKTIAAEELLQKMSEDKPVYLIDCQPIEEYKEGHIPGSVNVSKDSFGFTQDTLRHGGLCT